MAVDAAKFFCNLRGARQGAAAGPSGCTAEHLRILLDDEGCSDLLLHAAQLFAAGRVPAKVVDGLRLGRLVALQKPNGSITCPRHGRRLPSLGFSDPGATGFRCVYGCVQPFPIRALHTSWGRGTRTRSVGFVRTESEQHGSLC